MIRPRSFASQIIVDYFMLNVTRYWYRAPATEHVTDSDMPSILIQVCLGYLIMRYLNINTKFILYVIIANFNEHMNKNY